MSGRRRFVLPLVAILVIAAIALAAVGYVAGTRDPVDVATGPTAAAATTPVVSARRVPGVVARPVATRRLASAVNPVVDGLPATSCVQVVDGGVPIVDRRGAETFMPASNQKLLVALVALRVLGADSRLSTEVVATAPVVDGTITGDLWLVGGGDPLLSTDPYLPTIKYGPPPSTRMEVLADQVVAAGVRHVAGAVIGDEQRYDSARDVDTWSSSYAADGEVGPLSALSVNDARSYPAVGPPKGTVRPAVDPPAYAASTLTDLLRTRGVVVDGSPASGKVPAGTQPVTSMPSLTIAEIVHEMMVFSDNNTAELLLKELGHAAGSSGTTAAGLEVMKAELTEAGVDTSAFVLTDGSGLDRGNRISCASLATMLYADGPSGPVAATLPVAGQDGTLSGRFKNSAAAGKVFAKTGSLRDVAALSGWIATDAGREVAFSVLVNTGDITAARATTERITEALLSYPDQPDPATLGPEPLATP